MTIYCLGIYEAETGRGVDEYIYQLVTLLKQEINIEMLQFDLAESETYKASITDGVKIHHFPVPSLRGFKLPISFLEWLGSCADNSRFQLHGVFYPLNYSVAKALKRQKLSYIHTPHDSYSPESMRTRKFIKLLYMYLFEQFILKNASTVHAITPEGAQYIARYTQAPISTVTNFVPTPSTPKPADPYKKGKQICFIGRFDIYQKGFDTLIEAYALLLKRVSFPVKLVLIGKHTPVEKSQVEALIDKFLPDNAAKKRVYITGKISEAEKAEYLSQSHVYCQPSRFEGFGLSIVEALASATPVIITDTVPIHELITKHKGGRVARDMAQVAEALEELLSASPEAYFMHAQHAQECYRKEFSPEIFKPRMLRLLRGKANDALEENPLRTARSV